MSASQLEAAFLEDHRRLMRGLKGLLRALESTDDVSAVRLARELDEDAGPHMAFEEEVFYPRVAETRGQDFVDGLIAEHAVGQRAINALVENATSTRLTEDERNQLIEDVRLALRHALSCGTLLSEIRRSEPERERREIERLTELRDRGERWSERSYEER